MKLVGHKSNRDAIGARVKVTTPPSRTLYNHVTGSVGFLSTSDLRLHFGLGGGNVAITLEIQWPGGGVQTLRDIQGGQSLSVEELR